MPDLQTQLRKYGQELDHQYPDVGFGELLERIQPSRPHPSTTRRGLAIALAAAVVVVVLFAGTALLNLFGGTESPVATLPEPATTTVAPETTVPSGVEPPEPKEAEPVETSLGQQWTWIHFSGSLSELEAVTPPPSRLPVDVPIPTDTPDPAIEGVEWSSGGATTTARNGVTVTAVEHFGRVNWPAQFGENPVSFWDLSARRLDLGATGESRALTIDVVRGTPDAVEIRDSDTGELVLRLEATDPMAVVEQLTGEASRGPYWGPVLWSLRVDDGGASWVEPPWQGLAIDFVKVVSTPDDLVLVAVGRPAWEESNRYSILWSWRSEDGRSWQPLGEPLPIVEIATGLELAAKGDQVVALLTGDKGTLVGLVEGTHWEVVQANIEGGYNPEGFGPVFWGWVLAGFRQEQESGTWVERCEVWISANGLTWERIASSPDISAIDDVTATACYLSGDQVVALRDFAQGAGDLWIGSLED